ncbi:hypothetical protein G9A89_009558 [Geosiphon pyriformis]|nr:hypothetical protein G9A89_009558 [Geosiphon pyriformis]
MFKKKAPKGAFHDSVDGSFLQKKKVVLGNIKYSGDKKNISLNKFELGDNVFSNVDSLSNNEKGTNITGINVRSLLNLAANTSKVKCVNTSAVFGFPLGSPNFDMDDNIEVSFLSRLLIFLDKKWVDFKIIKTQVKVSVRKSFALDINLSAVKKKLMTAKTQLIKNFFLTINGYIIDQREGDYHKQQFQETRNLFKLGYSNQRNSHKYAKRDDRCHIDQDSANWDVAESNSRICQIGADRASCIKIVIPYWKGLSVDHFRVFLFTLPIGTTAHDLEILLEKADRKTCVINWSLVTDNWICCAVIDLVCCERCGSFGHSALKCDSLNVLVPFSQRSYKRVVLEDTHFQLAKLYAKKCVSISCPAAFGNKSWAQIMALLLVLVLVLVLVLPINISGLGGDLLLVLAHNSALNDQLASLECSLELLVNQVSGIVQKLSGVELVPLALLSYSNVSAVPMTVSLDLGQDMVLDSSELAFSSPSHAVSNVLALGPTSSKVLTVKMGSLESKFVTLKVSVNLVLVKLNQLYASLDFLMFFFFAVCNVHSINVSAKQVDIVYWHVNSGNIVSFIMETKLRFSIKPWIVLLEVFGLFS